VNWGELLGVRQELGEDKREGSQEKKNFISAINPKNYLYDMSLPVLMENRHGKKYFY